MPLVLAGLVVLGSGVLALVLVVRRLRRAASAVPIAHSERLTALPGYRRLLRRYRVMLIASLVLVVIAVGASGLLASRPVNASVQNPDRFNRDIVLCLDVSGSMIDYDSDLIGQFEELARRLGQLLCAGLPAHRRLQLPHRPAHCREGQHGSRARW
jgi:hypothetical protein